MQSGLFFSALLGGIVGFFLVLFIAVSLGLNEELRGMSFAFSGAAIVSHLSMLSFKKISTIERESNLYQMKSGLFFSALLGGIVGFWLGLLIAAFSGLHEKLHVMTIALFGTAIVSYLFMLSFKKISTIKKESIFFLFLVKYCIMIISIVALVFTFWSVPWL